MGFTRQNVKGSVMCVCVCEGSRSAERAYQICVAVDIYERQFLLFAMHVGLSSAFFSGRNETKCHIVVNK